MAGDHSKEFMNFKSMPNFRGLVESNVNKGPTWSVLRSSRPDKLTQEEFNQIEQMGIKSVIDLRSPKEINNATGEKLIDQSWPVIDIDVSTPTEAGIMGKLVMKNGRPMEETKNQDIGDLTRTADLKVTDSKHYFVNIVTRDYVKSLFKRAPWYMRCLFLFLLVVDRIFGTTLTAKAVVQHSINSKGLLNQYKDSLVFGQGSLRQALRLLTRPENVPAIICCVYGKDRTGVLSALVLGCLGRSKEVIAANYALSERDLKQMEAELLNSLARYGLNKHFAEAKYDTMMKLLEHIDEKYGSISDYLESIGFTKAEQEALKRNLLTPGNTEK